MGIASTKPAPKKNVPWRREASSGCRAELQELGLPASMKVHALLFFNIGVELGQLAFIVAVLAVAAAVTRIAIIGKHREKFAEAAVYAIGICSAYWLFERSVFLI